MKRIVVLTIVGALILGLLLPTALSAQGPPSQPQPAKPQGPTLLTIAEDLVLMPAGDPEEGDRFVSEWVDVTSYREFKLYARLTPYVVDETCPAVRVTIFESPHGAEDEGLYGVKGPYRGEGCEWWLVVPPGETPPPTAWWAIAYPFSGLHSKMTVFARNYRTTPVTISLYLLMATE